MIISFKINFFLFLINIFYANVMRILLYVRLPARSQRTHEHVQRCKYIKDNNVGVHAQQLKIGLFKFT